MDLYAWPHPFARRALPSPPPPLASLVRACGLLCVCVRNKLQIGVENHHMLDLFIQVPKAVRFRLSRRCREVYEYVLATQVTCEEDGDNDHAQQVSQ